MFTLLKLNICYSTESLVDRLEKVERKIEKNHLREEELSYLFVTTNAYYTYCIEQKDQCKDPGIEGFLMSFPFLKENILESILYGAKEKISFIEILRLIKGCFFYGEKKDSLGSTMETIEKTCIRIAKLKMVIEKIVKKNNCIPKWEDILLSIPLLPFSLLTSAFDKFNDLFESRDQIMQKSKENLCFLFIENKQISKKLSLLTSMRKLTEKMKNYHGLEQKDIVLVHKKGTSEEFKKLISEKKEIAKLILDEEEKERKRYMDKINENSRKLQEIIEDYCKQKDRSTIYFQSEILNIQSMTKLLLIAYKLSKYFEKMKHEEFIELLEKLNSNQLLSLSTIISLTDIFNESLYKITEKKPGKDQYKLEESTNERYFFNKIIVGKMKNPECSKSETVKNILNCVEKMKEMKTVESGEIYTKTRKDFLVIFENNKKENQEFKSNKVSNEEKTRK